jgi:hypothetical protein
MLFQYFGKEYKKNILFHAKTLAKKNLAYLQNSFNFNYNQPAGMKKFHFAIY